MRNSSGEYFHYAVIKFKDGVKIKDRDIITLDMIEPYESEAVRKVAVYIDHFLNPYRNSDFKKDDEFSTRHAKEIVALVHEAEDADE